MRKLLVSVAIATATLAAVPAAAQYRDSGWSQRNNDSWNQRDNRDNDGWQQRGPGRPAVNNLLRRLDQVETRIHRSARRGVISQREAFSLNRNANQIRGRLQYSSRNGLSGREFADLQVRVNRLEQRLRFERQDGDGRRG
jgi:hypothetical protein